MDHAKAMALTNCYHSSCHGAGDPMPTNDGGPKNELSHDGARNGASWSSEDTKIGKSSKDGLDHLSAVDTADHQADAAGTTSQEVNVRGAELDASHFHHDMNGASEGPFRGNPGESWEIMDPKSLNCDHVQTIANQHGVLDFAMDVNGSGSPVQGGPNRVMTKPTPPEREYKRSNTIAGANDIELDELDPDSLSRLIPFGDSMFIGEPGPDVGPGTGYRNYGQSDPFAAHGDSVPPARRQEAPRFIRKPLSQTELRRPKPARLRTQRLANPRSPSIRHLMSLKDLDERPIMVTTAMEHVIYDGPCSHCHKNRCLYDDAEGEPLWRLRMTRDISIIKTEGFCDHCVRNHCPCVYDARWGTHHAQSMLAKWHEKHGVRIASDSGTIIHYDTNTPVVTALPAAHFAQHETETGRRFIKRGFGDTYVTRLTHHERDLEAGQPDDDYDDDDDHSVEAFRMPSHGTGAEHRRGHVRLSGKQDGRCGCRCWVLAGIVFLLAAGVVVISLFAAGVRF
ncbi:hypothetical protein JX266_006623 [Neoarthrinium moseri]|nr:hypothetical protein JX266_006623 [Neoarthrinium moseri]